MYIYTTITGICAGILVDKQVDLITYMILVGVYKSKVMVILSFYLNLYLSVNVKVNALSITFSTPIEYVNDILSNAD